jgi:hypothetical protein
VTRGDYQFVLGDDNRVVDAPEWSITIHPGSTLSMSMILRRRGYMTTKCPRCGAVPKDEGCNGWINWWVMQISERVADEEYSSICPRRFRITMKEDERDSMATKAEGDWGGQSVLERRTPTSKPERTEPIWKRFRLLSIISVIEIDATAKKACQNYSRPGRSEGGKRAESGCEKCIRDSNHSTLTEEIKNPLVESLNSMSSSSISKISGNSNTGDHATESRLVCGICWAQFDRGDRYFSHFPDQCSSLINNPYSFYFNGQDDAGDRNITTSYQPSSDCEMNTW